MTSYIDKKTNEIIHIYSKEECVKLQEEEWKKGIYEHLVETALIAFAITGFIGALALSFWMTGIFH